MALDDRFGLIPAQKWLKIETIPILWREKIHEFQDQLALCNIEVLTIFETTYPEKLKILEEYPTVLYYQGNIDHISSSNMITVVGSRNYSRYSELLIQKILEPACTLGIGVVSGLAMGIDGLSHEAALKSGAFTIGVTGSGLHDSVFYPAGNLSLKERILTAEGLVLSEYAPYTKATAYSFSRRNRILAALTELTWVVQAGMKSGTLITSSLARDFR
jgi:DNA processing protein